MNTKQQRDDLDRFGVTDALAGHLHAHATEEKRLAEIEQSIHDLNKRVGEVEAKAFKTTRPAEPEQYICENAGKCKDDDCGSRASHYDINGGCHLGCTNSKGLRGSRCITLSEYRRKQAEKPHHYTTTKNVCDICGRGPSEHEDWEREQKDAEKKAEWEKNAKEGATVEFIANPCPTNAHDAPKHLKHTTISHLSSDMQGRPVAVVNGNWCCHLCARVIAPPKDERVPECGDIVEYISRKESARVIGIHGNAVVVALTNWPNEQPRNWMMSNLRVVDRPALVPGEQVVRRSDGRPGTVYLHNNELFVNCYEGSNEWHEAQSATTDDFARTHWNPKLHEGKK